LIVTDLTDGMHSVICNALMGTWVILITDGTVIEYPPEAYATVEQARNEAQRWVWIISGMGWLPIEESADNRWLVGDRDVRLVKADGEGSWVGTFWTWDGYPDPEATLLRGREEARSWVIAPVGGVLDPSSVEENDWMIVATFERKEEEAYAVAHRLKCVAAP
jgi:hypothetical protein